MEDLSEDIEWEARRHVIAFGISAWDTIGCDWPEEEKKVSFCAHADGLWFDCWYCIDGRRERWEMEITDEGGGISLFLHNGEVKCDALFPAVRKKEADVMIARLLRAAYLLGYPIEAFETDLGLTLTAHEKLELRHSMPREFWPPKWLNEEKSP